MDLHVLARQAVNVLPLPFFQKYTINAYIVSYCIFQAAIVQQSKHLVFVRITNYYMLAWLKAGTLTIQFVSPRVSETLLS